MPGRVVHWLKRWIPAKGAPSTIDDLVEREFGLRIKQRSYYDEALTHASLLDGDDTGLKSNERLEFLGDCALDLAIASYLFNSFPDDQEGALTQRKSKIVNRKTLNLLGERMGLPALIRSKMRRQDIQDTVVGNALEALIGAIYLDHGYKKTSKALLRMIKRHGADEKVHQTVDFKSKLFHWSQSRRKRLEFKVVKELSVDGESVYVMEALVDGVVFGEGEGRSKKLAEQAAARIAWKAVFDRGLLEDGAVEEEKPTPPKGRSRGPRGQGSREKADRRKKESAAPKEESAEKPRTRRKSSGEDKPKKAAAAKERSSAQKGRTPRASKEAPDAASPPQARRRMRRKPSDS